MSHWYDIATGAPRYQVPNKSTGGMRDTTLRDARQLGLVPSVTTILQEVSKPALENWKIDQALMAALTLPKTDNEPLDLFMARAKEDAKQQAIKAAERGTELHNALEQHYLGNGHLIVEEDRPFVNGVVEAVRAKYGNQEWIAEHSFASPLGYGGKMDLHCPVIVLDFKGKDFKEGEDLKPVAYDEHAMQLCAYAHGVCLPNAKRVNVFFDRRMPGKVGIHEWPQGGDHFERFLCLLEYWKRKSKYWPERGTAQAA